MEEVRVPESQIQGGKTALAPVKTEAENQKTQTNLERFLSSLEGPKDGDEALIQAFEQEARQLEEQADAEEKPFDYYAFLDTKSEVRAALDRRTNPEIQRLLPHVARALEEVLKGNPRLDIIIRNEELPKYYWEKRTTDLIRILKLDFPVLSDGSLGRSGDALLFNLIKVCAENNILHNALAKQLEKYRFNATVTHDTVAGAEGFTKYLGNAAGSLKSIFQERYPDAVTPPNLDFFAQQVDPVFYAAFNRNKYLGTKPSVDLAGQVRLQTARNTNITQ